MHSSFTGIWSSKDGKDRYSEFFTSALYPLSTLDQITTGASPTFSNLFLAVPEQTQITVSPVSASLITTISYVNYNNPLAAENVAISHPTPVSAALTTTISYVNYNNPLAAESVAISHPTPQAASLVVSISYINYTNWPTEQVSIGMPTPQSATLT